jgi:hypothetical protein
MQTPTVAYPRGTGAARLGFALVALALALALPLIEEPPAACVCAPTSPDVAFGHAERVFAGYLIARLPVPARSEPTKYPRIGSGYDVEFTFSVTNVWKGAVEETIRVRTGTTTCAAEFNRGTHYLVYARAHQGQFYTGLCSRNSPVERAAWDRLWLPKPRVLRADLAVGSLTSSDLIEMLNNGDSNERYAAAEALGRSIEIRDRVRPILRGIVGGRRPGDAAAAALALGLMGEGARAATADLEWRLAHGADADCASALEALIRIHMNDRNSVNRYVLMGLSSNFPSCLVSACEAAPRLSRADSLTIRQPAAERLARLIEHPHTNVRAHAIFALEYFPSAGRACLPVLESMSQADTSQYVRYAARLTVHRLTGKELPHR